jgi:hypothetical protein
MNPTNLNINKKKSPQTYQILTWKNKSKVNQINWQGNVKNQIPSGTFNNANQTRSVFR